MRKILPACFLALLAGCCATRNRSEVCYTASRPVSPPSGIVFVANGSGDFRTLSANLNQVIAEGSVPLQIETFVWSHGYGRYLADHVDHANHLAEGRRLAVQVAGYRQSCPGLRVYLVGHSAGCAVVLAAAETLPPDSVDGIILLAPSVCVTYDLRPALRTARGGIDVFHSDQDRVILGLGMQIVGTADRRCRTAAGQVGFTPAVVSPADSVLYYRLRQHPWDHVAQWSGNDGGHYGSCRASFLKACVLSLLAYD